jgi:hypothetical protein
MEAGQKREQNGRRHLPRNPPEIVLLCLPPGVISLRKHSQVRGSALESDADDRMGKILPSREPDKRLSEGGEKGFECGRRESPVIIGMVVNREVHDAADHGDAAFRREYPVDLSKRPAGMLDMFKRVEAEDASNGPGGNIDAVQIEKRVDTRALTNVGAHIIESRKKRTQIRKSFLAADLKGPELIYRFRERKARGCDGYKSADVLSQVPLPFGMTCMNLPHLSTL